MRGLVVTPGKKDSLRLVEDLPDPPADEGEVLVEALDVGVCGTDREIIAADYGEGPEGSDHLVIGHESLGRVIEDASGTFTAGDLVAGIVRQPDPVPCPNCAVGEWDMCRNGLFTERGIKGLHGFARERWRVPPSHAVRLDPALGDAGVLLEPTSIVAKAWDHIGRIGARAHWSPRTVLVTGAGPIGLLAALIASQRGYEVHVLDRATDGPKPALVAKLGAEYHTGKVSELTFEPDVVLECTGAPPVVVGVIDKVGPDGIVCLTGVSSVGGQVGVDAGALNRAVVLDNNVVFGSVNANHRHWSSAADVLGAADPDWLASLMTRRVPLERYAEAYAPADSDDVKVVVAFAA